MQLVSAETEKEHSNNRKLPSPDLHISFTCIFPLLQMCICSMALRIISTAVRRYPCTSGPRTPDACGVLPAWSQNLSPIARGQSPLRLIVILRSFRADTEETAANSSSTSTVRFMSRFIPVLWIFRGSFRSFSDNMVSQRSRLLAFPLSDSFEFWQFSWAFLPFTSSWLRTNSCHDITSNILQGYSKNSNANLSTTNFPSTPWTAKVSGELEGGQLQWKWTHN